MFEYYGKMFDLDAQIADKHAKRIRRDTRSQYYDKEFISGVEQARIEERVVDYLRTIEEDGRYKHPYPLPTVEQARGY